LSSKAEIFKSSWSDLPTTALRLHSLCLNINKNKNVKNLKMSSESREISIQGKGIYGLCSRQSTKKVAVCEEKIFCSIFETTKPTVG
jgi:hypothetical protein